MSIRFCKFWNVFYNIPEGDKWGIAHFITYPVLFDKKEKGVVVTAQDSCQLSPNKEEIESLLWQIKVRFGAATSCFNFPQGELVISCHANNASMKDVSQNVYNTGWATVGL